MHSENVIMRGGSFSARELLAIDVAHNELGYELDTSLSSSRSYF